MQKMRKMIYGIHLCSSNHLLRIKDMAYVFRICTVPFLWRGIDEKGWCYKNRKVMEKRTHMKIYYSAWIAFTSVSVVNPCHHNVDTYA